ncbi:hypothetical protein TRFO_08040 [Tritrichomonas foetus]|uniref:Uncharacterized protein n=1 Tax=Tritrichomonas foetus TaxID=1144522 RepID=A0A1J4JLW7_9EUKA|nr:hypothetical protein TRFO_08040 [Tritrichomonas foetus]|eukprot:OHT00087.1 hypothetical protein TRFO_08040 [Tritrichomonas foetus]
MTLENWLSIDPEIVVDVPSSTSVYNIIISTATVHKYKPLEKTVSLSLKKSQDVQIVAKSEDLQTLSTFYKFLNTAMNEICTNRFLLWLVTDACNGFIASSSHLHNAAVGNQPIKFILGLVPENVVNRLTKLKKGSQLPEELHKLFGETPDISVIGSSTPAAVLETKKIEKMKSRTEIIEATNQLEFYPAESKKEEKSKLLNKIINIQVFAEFADILLAINSTMFTMKNHLYPRGRILDINYDLIFEIINEIIMAHIPSEENDED